MNTPELIIDESVYTVSVIVTENITQTTLDVTEDNNVTINVEAVQQVTEVSVAGFGLKGDSAYQIWLNEGNIGTEEDFLLSLKGDTGDKGEKGEKGEKGDTGDVIIYQGVRSSSANAGTMGDISITDDYVYFCVQTGTAGNAIWKKSLLFTT